MKWKYLWLALFAFSILGCAPLYGQCGGDYPSQGTCDPPIVTGVPPSGGIDDIPDPQIFPTP